MFRLAEVKENYDFGVATDGLRWVFIDKKIGITRFCMAAGIKTMKTDRRPFLKLTVWSRISSE